MKPCGCAPVADGVQYAPFLRRARDVAALPDFTTMSPILLVEDNPDDETLTFRALEKQGISHHVVVARDGAEALDYLFGTGLYAGREVSEIPRLILLDLKLAKIDGLDVLRRLCANSYVRKPVDFDQFFDALRHIVTDWLRLNEPPPPTRDLR